MNFFAIDGGTTNTRVALVCEGKIAEVVKIPIGARASIDGNEELKREIGQAIEKIRGGHPETVPERIIACGMLTSEFGLMEIPHICLPVGISELHENMKSSQMFGLPIAFISGVKDMGEGYLSADMMRGEECELAGLMEICPELDFSSCVVVLPGSHSKHIYLDGQGRMEKISTCMTGEMIYALSGHTVLVDAVNLSTCELSRDYLMLGYEQSRHIGLNAALMKVRILKNIYGGSPVETYSFFMGVILADELDLLIRSEKEKIILAGKRQIKEAMNILLSAYAQKEVTVISEEAVDKSVIFGMKRIFEYR